MPKHTKRYVVAVEPKAKGDRYEWDEELKGPGLRVKPSGRRTSILPYTHPEGLDECGYSRPLFHSANLSSKTGFSLL